MNYYMFQLHVLYMFLIVGFVSSVRVRVGKGKPPQSTIEPNSARYTVEESKLQRQKQTPIGR